MMQNGIRLFFGLLFGCVFRFPGSGQNLYVRKGASG